MDDPSTTGVTEGFGLMFYQSRMYDPSIGRFTSADSIVPGGMQGLDRYSYVNNSPIRYTDPSGHKCVPEDECEGLSRPQPALTENGLKMYKLYLYYASHPNGDWNSNGGAFTAADFLAWILMIESAGNTTLLGYNMQVFSRQLWGTGYDSQGNLSHTPYCPSNPCVNGIFNFVGKYSQSAMGRYNNLTAGDFEAVEQLPTNYENYGKAGYTIQGIGNDVVVNPKWTDYNNDVPVHTGNYKEGEYDRVPWVTKMCPDTQMFTNALNGIVYRTKGENGWWVVVFTLNQADY
jgi:RHS repeat-associated protein